MAAPPPAAAAGGGTESKKRRRAPAKKGKDALKKQAIKKDADEAVVEEDVVWEAVVVPVAENDDGADEAQEHEEAQEIAGRLASDKGQPPKPCGPMIRRHADSDPEDNSDFDAPQDGGIKRLVQSVRNRKRQTSRGHQLPPEERAREKELEAKRREKAERKRKRKEAAKGQGGDAERPKRDATEDVAAEEKEDDAGAVLEIDMEDRKDLRENQGSEGPKKKTLRMTKAEKGTYRDAHRAHLIAYVAHLLQLNAAANAAEVHAMLLSMLPAAEWPRRDVQGVAHADVPMLLALSRWVKSAFSSPEAETKPVINVLDEQKVTPKKRKTISKKKAKKEGEDEESDFEIKTEKIKKEAESSNEDVVVPKATPKRKSPKASSSPLKTQAEPINISSLPAWSEQYWTERLLSVLRREQTPSQVDQQVLFVALMRALGLNARCARSVAYMPLAKTKDFSLTPKKDEEAAGKPYPAHGNDLALDMCWAEVYSPQLHRWVHVDVGASSVNKPRQPEDSLAGGRKFTSLIYVIGVDKQAAVRDVTRRYAKSFASVASAARTDNEWWTRALQKLSPVPDADTAARDRDEEEELTAKDAESGEFPTSKELYRKHPLYVLEKFVGKFDIIYPKDKPLGFCGQDPIWPRSALHHLHTQDGWLKEGREIRIGEVPIKRVPKRRRKKKEGTGEELKDLDTELFGLWQTEPYQRPVAVDGIVPKNAHGNVYLYKKWMIPVGCVQVNLPQIARTCRSLKVDYAQALVNWEPRGGFNCPVFEGVVICEEHYAAVREAWEEQYSRRVAKEVQEQRRKAVLLWRKFAKALLVRDRLQRTYATSETPEKAGDSEKIEVEEEVKQLPTLANLSRHVHSFSAGVQDAGGKWSKSCSCGYSVQYEEI